MEHELEMLLKQESQLFTPTAGMTYREKEEYERIEAQDYYDVIETEDGLDAIAYGSDPADQAEEDEEELIRLFGINFNHIGN